MSSEVKNQMLFSSFLCSRTQHNGWHMLDSQNMVKKNSLIICKGSIKIFGDQETVMINQHIQDWAKSLGNIWREIDLWTVMYSTVLFKYINCLLKNLCTYRGQSLCAVPNEVFELPKKQLQFYGLCPAIRHNISMKNKQPSLSYNGSNLIVLISYMSHIFCISDNNT